MLKSSSIWPPSYVLKKHPRAKHVKLYVNPKKGLQLTVPKRFNNKEIPFILEQHRAWIEKQLVKLAETTSSPVELPQQIHLLSVQQIWNIQYQQNSGKLRIITRPHQELVVSGVKADFWSAVNLADQKPALTPRTLLTKWIRAYAKKILLELLQKMSVETQLPYSTATIRNQTSRWGSCSAEKAISLNYKLIFLPFELTRHIIIHELCHTKVLNHSERFWRLVEQYDEDWQQNRIKMRNVDQYIPRWLE